MGKNFKSLLIYPGQFIIPAAAGVLTESLNELSEHPRKHQRISREGLHPCQWAWVNNSQVITFQCMWGQRRLKTSKHDIRGLPDDIVNKFRRLGLLEPYTLSRHDKQTEIEKCLTTQQVYLGISWWKANTEVDFHFGHKVAYMVEVSGAAFLPEGLVNHYGVNHEFHIEPMRNWGECEVGLKLNYK